MSNTPDYIYNFYVVNSKSKLIYGFDDFDEAKQYARINHYKVCCRSMLTLNPENLSNWSKTFPEKGLPTYR